MGSQFRVWGIVFGVHGGGVLGVGLVVGVWALSFTVQIPTSRVSTVYRT